ncbi:hypothetical protein HII31_06181, partial [Pseudocercospora fuligena]
SQKETDTVPGAERDVPAASEEPVWEPPLSKKEKKKREKAARKSGDSDSFYSGIPTPPELERVQTLDEEVTLEDSAASTPKEEAADDYFPALSKKEKKKREKEAKKQGFADIVAEASGPKDDKSVFDDVEQSRDVRGKKSGSSFADLADGILAAGGVAAAATALNGSNDSASESPSGSSSKKDKKKKRKSKLGESSFDDPRDYKPEADILDTTKPPLSSATEKEPTGMPGGWDESESPPRKASIDEQSQPQAKEEQTSAGVTAEPESYNDYGFPASNKDAKSDASRSEPVTVIDTSKPPLSQAWDEPEPKPQANTSAYRSSDDKMQEREATVSRSPEEKRQSRSDKASADIERKLSGSQKSTSPDDARSVASESAAERRKSRREEARRGSDYASGYDQPDYAYETQSVAASEPAYPGEEEKRRKRRSKHEDDDDDTRSVTSSRSRRDKDERRRSKYDDDDTASMTSSRSRRDKEESPSVKKDKKGLFGGLFGRNKSFDGTSSSSKDKDRDGVPLSRSSTRDSKDRDDDDDDRRRRKKKHRDSEYGDDDDDTRSVKSESHRRHRSAGDRDDDKDSRERRRRSTHDDRDDSRSAISEAGHRHHHRRRTDDDGESLSRTDSRGAVSESGHRHHSRRSTGDELGRDSRDQSFLENRVEGLPPLPASRPVSPDSAVERREGRPLEAESGRGSMVKDAMLVGGAVVGASLLADALSSKASDDKDHADDITRSAEHDQRYDEVHKSAVEGVVEPETPAKAHEVELGEGSLSAERPASLQRPVSSTAVPLRFPFGHAPTTPSSADRPSAKERAKSFSSPSTAGPQPAGTPTTPSSAKSRQGRPHSSEFKGVMPLYLVERNRQTPEVEEGLPSLPSSKPSSRASSVHGSDDGFQSAAEEWDSPSASHRNLPALDLAGIGAASYQSEDETTPKATHFPQTAIPWAAASTTPTAEKREKQQPQFFTWEDYVQDEKMHEQQEASREEPSSTGERNRSRSPSKVKALAAAAMLGTAAVYGKHKLESQSSEQVHDLGPVGPKYEYPLPAPLEEPTPAEPAEKPEPSRKGSKKKGKKSKKQVQDAEPPVEEFPPRDPERQDTEDFFDAESHAEEGTVSRERGQPVSTEVFETAHPKNALDRFLSNERHAEEGDSHFFASAAAHTMPVITVQEASPDAERRMEPKAEEQQQQDRGYFASAAAHTMPVLPRTDSEEGAEQYFEVERAEEERAIKDKEPALPPLQRDDPVDAEDERPATAYKIPDAKSEPAPLVIDERTIVAAPEATAEVAPAPQLTRKQSKKAKKKQRASTIFEEEPQTAVEDSAAEASGTQTPANETEAPRDVNFGLSDFSQITHDNTWGDSQAQAFQTSMDDAASKPRLGSVHDADGLSLHDVQVDDVHSPVEGRAAPETSDNVAAVAKTAGDAPQAEQHDVPREVEEPAPAPESSETVDESSREAQTPAGEPETPAADDFFPIVSKKKGKKGKKGKSTWDEETPVEQTDRQNAEEGSSANTEAVPNLQNPEPMMEEPRELVNQLPDVHTPVTEIVQPDESAAQTALEEFAPVSSKKSKKEKKKAKAAVWEDFQPVSEPVEQESEPSQEKVAEISKDIVPEQGQAAGTLPDDSAAQPALEEFAPVSSKKSKKDKKKARAAVWDDFEPVSETFEPEPVSGAREQAVAGSSEDINPDQDQLATEASGVEAIAPEPPKADPIDEAQVEEKPTLSRKQSKKDKKKKKSAFTWDLESEPMALESDKQEESGAAVESTKEASADAHDEPVIPAEALNTVLDERAPDDLQEMTGTAKDDDLVIPPESLNTVLQPTSASDAADASQAAEQPVPEENPDDDFKPALSRKQSKKDKKKKKASAWEPEPELGSEATPLETETRDFAKPDEARAATRNEDDLTVPPEALNTVLQTDDSREVDTADDDSKPAPSRKQSKKDKKKKKQQSLWEPEPEAEETTDAAQSSSQPVEQATEVPLPAESPDESFHDDSFHDAEEFNDTQTTDTFHEAAETSATPEQDVEAEPIKQSWADEMEAEDPSTVRPSYERHDSNLVDDVFGIADGSGELHATLSNDQNLVEHETPIADRGLEFEPERATEDMDAFGEASPRASADWTGFSKKKGKKGKKGAKRSEPVTPVAVPSTPVEESEKSRPEPQEHDAAIDEVTQLTPADEPTSTPAAEEDFSWAQPSKKKGKKGKKSGTQTPVVEEMVAAEPASETVLEKDGDIVPTIVEHETPTTTELPEQTEQPENETQEPVLEASSTKSLPEAEFEHPLDKPAPQQPVEDAQHTAEELTASTEQVLSEQQIPAPAEEPDEFTWSAPTKKGKKGKKGKKSGTQTPQAAEETVQMTEPDRDVPGEEHRGSSEVTETKTTDIPEASTPIDETLPTDPTVDPPQSGPENSAPAVAEDTFEADKDMQDAIPEEEFAWTSSKKKGKKGKKSRQQSMADLPSTEDRKPSETEAVLEPSRDLVTEDTSPVVIDDATLVPANEDQAEPATVQDEAEDDFSWAPSSKKKRSKKGKKAQDFEPDALAEESIGPVETDMPSLRQQAFESVEEPSKQASETVEEPIKQVDDDEKPFEESAAVEAEAEDIWALPTSKKNKKGKKGKKSGLDTPEEQQPETRDIEMNDTPIETATPDTTEPAPLEADDFSGFTTSKKKKGKKGKKSASGTATPLSEAVEADHDDGKINKTESEVQAPEDQSMDVEDTAQNVEAKAEDTSDNKALERALDQEANVVSEAASKGTEIAEQHVKQDGSQDADQEMLAQRHVASEEIEPAPAPTAEEATETPVPAEAEQQSTEVDDWSTPASGKKKGKKGKKSKQLALDDEPTPSEDEPRLEEAPRGDKELPSETNGAQNETNGDSIPVDNAIADVSEIVTSQTPAEETDDWFAPQSGKKKGKKGKKNRSSTLDDFPPVDAEHDSKPEETSAETSEVPKSTSPEFETQEETAVNDSWSMPSSGKKSKKGKKNKQLTFDEPATAESTPLEEKVYEPVVGGEDMPMSNAELSAEVGQDEPLSEVQDEDVLASTEQEQTNTEPMDLDHSTPATDQPREAIVDVDAPSAVPEEAPEEFAFTTKKSKKDKKKAKKGTASMSNSWNESAETSEVPREAEISNETAGLGAAAVAGAIAAAALATESEPQTPAEEDDWAAFSTKKLKKDKKKAKKSGAPTPAIVEDKEIAPFDEVEDKTKSADSAAQQGLSDAAQQSKDLDVDLKPSNESAEPQPPAEEDEWAGFSLKKSKKDKKKAKKSGAPTPAIVSGEPAVVDDNLMSADTREQQEPVDLAKQSEVVDLDPVLPSEPVEPARASPRQDPSQDIDFAATLAAGLADSGFDPKMVIDDPVFHRRASPTGQAEADPEEVFSTTTSKRKKNKKSSDSRDLSREVSPAIGSSSVEDKAPADDVNDIINKSLDGAGFDPELIEKAMASNNTSSADIDNDQPEISFATTKRKKGKKAKKESASGTEWWQVSAPPEGQPDSQAAQTSEKELQTPAETATDDQKSQHGWLVQDELDIDAGDKAYREYKKKKRQQRKLKAAAQAGGLSDNPESAMDDTERSTVVSDSETGLSRATTKDKRPPQPLSPVLEKAAPTTSALSEPSVATTSPTSAKSSIVSSVFPGLERVKRRAPSVPAEEEPSQQARRSSSGSQSRALLHTSEVSQHLPVEVPRTPPPEHERRLSNSVSKDHASDLYKAAAGVAAISTGAVVASALDKKDTDAKESSRSMPADEPSWSFAALQDDKQHQPIRDSGYQEGKRASQQTERSSREIPEIHTSTSFDSLRQRRSLEPLRISTPSSPEKEWKLQTPKQRSGPPDRNSLEAHARTPSADTPLLPTSKNRTSYLFQSPPDILAEATDPFPQLSEARTPTHTSDHGAHSRPRASSRGSEPSPVSRTDGANDRSAFSPTSPRAPLDSIPEESHHARKRSKARNEVGGPEHIKAINRTETPQNIREKEQALSPNIRPSVTIPSGGSARSISNPLSTSDEVYNRLSWPAVDEEHETVNLDRRHASQPRNMPDPRSPSVMSNRSNASAGHFKSPQELRSYSRNSNQSNRSSTPSLRRISLSGDLRAASRRGLSDAGSAVGARSSPKTIPFEPPPTPPLNDDEIEGSASRAVDMNDDVFVSFTMNANDEKDADFPQQGYGDAQQQSQVSPTRPPSVRKRQSMHINELESRLDQLVAENRALQDAREAGGLQNGANGQSLQEMLNARDLQLQAKDAEINQIKAMLQPMQEELQRLTEMNNGLTEANRNLVDDTNGRYATLQAEHSQAHEQWQSTAAELEHMRSEHGRITSGMRDIVEAEIANALADKNAEILRLREQLDIAAEQIRALQVQIQGSKSSDFLIQRDEDYFDGACQKLCQHVQQWVLRFSKMSDNRVCRLSTELNDDKIEARLDNAILDGSDVDKLLGDRVRRRDVFMSVVMTMVWEYVFTRYLFGMDREQRQKLKALEKLLSEVGPPRAVAHWRATTLTLLAKRPQFDDQCSLDTEAVANEIFEVLCRLLPPPSASRSQLLTSLQKVLRIAVDLSIEMRTQRAEYIMLPPLQPEYDTNGDLVRKVYFNASLMNERSGFFSSNEELAAEHAVVKVVLFPLVVKKGDDVGEGEEEIVVCPAQVLVQNDNGKGKKVVRVMSGAMEIDDPIRSTRSRQSNRSLVSEAPGSVGF